MKIPMHQAASTHAAHRPGYHRSLVTAATLLIAAAATPLMAAHDDENDEEIPFDEARLFFELNDTDGDLGIHAKVDGGPWRRLSMEDPNERRILGIEARGRLRRQGLTEIFFESAEPPFESDEPGEALPPEIFFRRFPEGTYEIEGVSLDREELESEVELTHVMPAPPVVTVNALPMAEQCDDEEPGYDAPSLTPPVVIAWVPVTESHPDPDGGGAGVQPPVPVTIKNYEVVVETDLEIDGEEFTTVMHAVVPADITEMSIPAEFLAQSDSFKYEILAREESDNQTAVESCFEIAEPE